MAPQGTPRTSRSHSKATITRVSRDEGDSVREYVRVLSEAPPWSRLVTARRGESAADTVPATGVGKQPPTKERDEMWGRGEPGCPAVTNISVQAMRLKAASLSL